MPSGSLKRKKKEKKKVLLDLQRKDTKCPWIYFRQVNSVGGNKIKEEKETRTQVTETKSANLGYSSGHKCNLSK